MTQVRKLLEALRAESLALPVLCGGVIPADDALELRAMGVADVITPGALSADFIGVFDRALGVSRAA